jgi:hypothetical protein
MGLPTMRSRMFIYSPSGSKEIFWSIHLRRDAVESQSGEKGEARRQAGR